MNFEQALAHMKRGGTAKWYKFSYRFSNNTTDNVMRLAIIESVEGEKQSRTLFFVPFTPDMLVSTGWELID